MKLTPGSPPWQIGISGVGFIMSCSNETHGAIFSDFSDTMKIKEKEIEKSNHHLFKSTSLVIFSLERLISVQLKKQQPDDIWHGRD